jgi:monothiol glutaredoxin
MSTIDLINKQIQDNAVILYMKGTPEAPECGFSARAIAALAKTGKEYAYVNVLKAPMIRERLPQVTQWPTFPQLIVNGELVGGSDIICDMQADGSLDQLLAGEGV